MRSERAAVLLLLALSVPVRAAEVLERILAVADNRPICLSDVRAVEALDGLGRAAALERTIDESLIFHEAFRLPQAAVEPVPGGDPARARAAHRRAVIARYIAFRFRPQVRVSEEQVREASKGGEAAAADVRARLIEEEVEARVGAWVKDLRAAAQIRYNPAD